LSLYLQRSRTLVSGDALVSEGGRLLGPRPTVTPDMDEAVRSLAKLAPLDVVTAITYHGGVVDRDVARSLAELAGAG
jgi:glyoxylase-like metal-dependent hydrolase (beta-lactamase superfamily II)